MVVCEREGVQALVPLLPAALEGRLVADCELLVWYLHSQGPPTLLWMEVREYAAWMPNHPVSEVLSRSKSSQSSQRRNQQRR